MFMGCEYHHISFNADIVQLWYSVVVHICPEDIWGTEVQGAFPLSNFHIHLSGCGEV